MDNKIYCAYCGKEHEYKGVSETKCVSCGKFFCGTLDVTLKELKKELRTQPVYKAIDPYKDMWPTY